MSGVHFPNTYSCHSLCTILLPNRIAQIVKMNNVSPINLSYLKSVCAHVCVNPASSEKENGSIFKYLIQ